MRYVCSICGYVYDEAREAGPFAQLPEDWECPVCGAPKAAFAPEAGAAAPEAAPAAPAPIEEAAGELSPGVLSALCSNLARGCEKQYHEEEAALFRRLADYFAAATPAAPQAELSQLADLLRDDLDRGYPAVSAAAKERRDRGTLRVCVWGEKVTRMLRSLVERYQKEGGAFLQGRQVYVCSVCGFVFVGDAPPERCPVCKVPDWKFDRIEGRVRA